jgi:2-polyprenyl-6-methoxyphenol hydroxylase-like FAD-dependent oxidoreductase
MSLHEESTSVLIVGGGPVGLAAAIELGMRGVSCILVERRDGSIPLPKMNGVNARTMEFCRRWGISERVRNAGWPRDFPRRILYVTSLAGYQLGCLDYGLHADRKTLSTSPEHFQRCPQTWFDPILKERAASLPGNKLYHRTRLDSFEEREGAIIAEVTDLVCQQRRRIIADYMVACDGAKSGVRQTLGIEMEGSTQLSLEVNVYFESEAPLTAHDKGRAVMIWLIGPEGMWGALSAIDGRRLWRLWLSQMSPNVDIANFDASHYIRRAVGRDVSYRTVGILPWSRQQLVAKQYQRGRIFLCGDAVHNLTPTGGFGMNTGIQDAVDISWKLAGVIHGWAHQSILRSYQLERWPIGKRNVDEATLTFGKFLALPKCPGIEEASWEGKAQRQLISDLLVSEQFNREFENEGIVLGYRYEGSPICIPDGTPSTEDHPMRYVPSARPGSRAPHFWLSEGRSILDEFGDGFVLIRFGPQPPTVGLLLEAASKVRVPMRLIDVSNNFAHTLYERSLALVRPDGHVAWRADCLPPNVSDLVEIIRGSC